MILAKLDEPIAMSFNEDTPLEDVLKYVKQATTTEKYTGIPIYVDPLGLQEAEKSMTSTVRNMDLEGVPLRRTLQLMLKQIDLVYFVEDGLLYITASDSEIAKRHLEPAIAEPSPIMQKITKAERGELSVTEMQELLELLKTRRRSSSSRRQSVEKKRRRQRKSRPQNTSANRQAFCSKRYAGCSMNSRPSGRRQKPPRRNDRFVGIGQTRARRPAADRLGVQWSGEKLGLTGLESRGLEECFCFA